MKGPLLKKAREVDVRVQDVRARFSKKLTAGGGGTVELPRGKVADILGASLREQSSGFVIDVVCTDAASGKPERYFYDSQGSESYRVSPRCVLSDDSVGLVHVSSSDKVSVGGAEGGFRVFTDVKRGSVTLRIRPPDTGANPTRSAGNNDHNDGR